MIKQTGFGLLEAGLTLLLVVFMVACSGVSRIEDKISVVEQNYTELQGEILTVLMDPAVDDELKLQLIQLDKQAKLLFVKVEEGENLFEHLYELSAVIERITAELGGAYESR